MHLEERIDFKTFEEKKLELEKEQQLKTTELLQLQGDADSEKDLRKRIEAMRKLLTDTAPMKKFDRKVFESIVEKVIVGGYDEQGNVDPSMITFVYKTGFEDKKNGDDFKPPRRNAADKKLHSISSSDGEKLPQQSSPVARRDGLPDGKEVMKKMNQLSDHKISEARIVKRVSVVGIAGNIILSVFKLIAGILGHSGAMISDAVHSLSDVFATVIAYMGVNMSKKKPDEEHQYGHERIECAASLILGFILLMTGFEIGIVTVRKIVSGQPLAVPGMIALIAAIVSIATKEAMFHYTRHCAKLLNSEAFMADAWHHRSDALSSVGSLIGIGGARLGFPILDPVASLFICLCIFKVAYDIIRGALDNMIDTSCGREYEDRLSEMISKVNGVKRIDMLHTRTFGNKIYVDAEIAVDGTMTLDEAHAIAEKVHDRVEAHDSNIKHIMIHVNPYHEKRSS